MINNKTMRKLKMMGIDDDTIVAINDIDLPKEMKIKKNNELIKICPTCHKDIQENHYLFKLKKRCPNCKQKIV